MIRRPAYRAISYHAAYRGNRRKIADDSKQAVHEGTLTVALIRLNQNGNANRTNSVCFSYQPFSSCTSCALFNSLCEKQRERMILSFDR